MLYCVIDDRLNHDEHVYHQRSVASLVRFAAQFRATFKSSNEFTELCRADLANIKYQERVLAVSPAYRGVVHTHVIIITVIVTSHVKIITGIGFTWSNALIKQIVCPRQRRANHKVFTCHS